MSDPSKALTGRCLCGEVRWAYGGPRGRNLICHCESCQRATSSGFAAFVGCQPDAVRWSGPITHFESSPQTWRGFCSSCGARLYFASARWPGEIYLHAGTLDNRDAFEPDEEVVRNERAAWIDRLPYLPKHDDFGSTPDNDAVAGYGNPALAGKPL